jgi:hypothetical protein
LLDLGPLAPGDFVWYESESEPESALWKSSSVSALASMDAIVLKIRLTSFAGVLLLVESTSEEAGELTDREDLAYIGVRSRTSPRSGA